MANIRFHSLDSMRIEKQNIPTPLKPKINTRFRNYQSDVDGHTRKLASYKSDRQAKYGGRYTDSPDNSGDAQLEQRQQLLNGTDRLERSSNRLRDSQRMALETEEIGQNTLADLGRQRETISHTRDTLLESEGYTDRSIKTLRGMARR
jgi:vesicle transport through interaction with t-SNAREs protein 1